jgi:hypothetical protein
VDGSSIYVVWADNPPVRSNREIFYKQSTDGGATWSSSQNLSGTTGVSDEPSIAVVGSNIHVVWQETITGNSEIFYKKSTDGGATWSSSQNLSGTTGNSHYSSIAVNGGNIHVAWSDNTSGKMQIFYTRSADAPGVHRRTSPELQEFLTDYPLLW